MPKTLPVRRWHSRQWQMEIRTGSPAVASRSCPQLQDAWRVVMVPPDVESAARLSPASQPPNRASQRLPAVSDPPKVRKVMSLKNKGDFLMHGVVLQNRCFSDPPARCFT